MAHFGPGFFAFLRDLKRHNDRDWFAARRDRYVAEVEGPMLAFIGDFAPRLRAISPAYVADRRRMGGSMFRIHRDTRFSPDKSPFKTWAAARFAHEARRKVAGVPAFYVHLGPDERFGGGEYILATPTMHWFWDQYVPDRARRAEPLVSPLHADLAGLPPLYVSAAELDPLRDDSERLAARLALAGIDFDYRLWRGVCHACIMMSRLLPAADEQIAQVADFLRRRLTD